MQRPIIRMKAAMEQKEVIAIMLEARTKQEVAEARRVRNLWVNEHPNDLVAWDASRGLEIIAKEPSLPFVPIERRKRD